MVEEGWGGVGEGMSGKERGGVGAGEEWRKEEGREGRDGGGEEGW